MSPICTCRAMKAPLTAYRATWHCAGWTSCCQTAPPGSNIQLHNQAVGYCAIISYATPTAQRSPHRERPTLKAKSSQHELLMFPTTGPWPRRTAAVAAAVPYLTLPCRTPSCGCADHAAGQAGEFSPRLALPMRKKALTPVSQIPCAERHPTPVHWSSPAAWHG